MLSSAHHQTVDRCYYRVAWFINKNFMQKLATIALIVTIFSMGCIYEAQDTRFGKIGSLFTSKSEPQAPETEITSQLSNTTDIHFSAKYCLECHVESPPKKGPKFLRYGGDFKRLCRCHYSAAQNYVHPVDLKPSGYLKPRIPAELPLQDGKVTCATCHNIFIQCHDKPLEKIFLKENKFLRGAPYRDRTELCFKCHDIAQYRRYNPHLQLNNKEQIIEVRCLYCHTEVPDEKRANSEDVKLRANPKEICLGCHGRITENQWHAKHLRKPPDQILKRIEELQDQYQVILPLDADGKITCPTCHNPHQKGVIPDKRAGAKGAGEKFRQRLTDNMCIRCHPMQDLSKYPELGQ
jgi:hypothetical protein